MDPLRQRKFTRARRTGFHKSVYDTGLRNPQWGDAQALSSIGRSDYSEGRP